MLKDFKKFIMRGNVMDLAVAVVIGGAFGRIVTSFVNDIITPFLGVILGRVDFTSWQWVISRTNQGEVELAIKFGHFIQSIFDFLIISLAIYFVVRAYQKSKKEPEVQPDKPKTVPEDIKLLSEIRDLLKENN